MNKKFLVVALMAALSTVGYAVSADEVDQKVNALEEQLFGEGTGVLGNLENKDTELQNQVNGLNDKLFAEGTGVLGNLENKDTELQNQVNDLNDKLFAEGTGVLGNLEVADQNLAAKDTELENKVNDLNDKLFAEGTGVLGNLEVADQNLQDQIDGMKTDISNAGLAADAANEGMLQNKEDIKDINDKIKDYDTVKEEANSALILGQENDKKINDLYANKVDNSKFEEHKKQQEAKDDNQDKNIQANKDAIEKETADRKAEDEKLQGQINEFNNKFAGYDGRLSGLEKKVDHLDDKMNKGLSLMAAMNAVDFQNVQTGEMALGAGIGHYGNAQSVALGVAYAPVEDLTVNAKYSITAGDPDSFAVGAGATYKFKVGR